MDLLGTVWWLTASVISLTWSVVWFLISGWVATAVQLLIVVAVIYGFKYGWRRAPFEAWRHASRLGRPLWGWMRARETGAIAPRIETRDVIREVRVKEWGDINLSTVLSLGVLAGLAVYGLWMR